MPNTTTRGQQTDPTHTDRDSRYARGSGARRTRDATEGVKIGSVHHLGGQWRAAIKIDDHLVLVARSRGESFYLARDPQLVASFRPDPTLAEEIRGVRTHRPRDPR
jgi:hypothetical protein